MKSETEIQQALNYICPRGKMKIALFLVKLQLELDSHCVSHLDSKWRLAGSLSLSQLLSEALRVAEGRMEGDWSSRTAVPVGE